MADKDVTEPSQSDDLPRPENDAIVSKRPRKKSDIAAEAEVDGGAVTTKKGRPTPKRSEAVATDLEPTRKRVGPGQFVKECVAELKKVVWPTGDQLRQYFIVVLVFVVIMILYVSGLDALFGWILLKLLG